MAQVKTEGLYELGLDMKALAGLPDDVVDDMLQAGGEIIAAAQRRRYQAQLYNEKNLGKHLADAVKVTPKSRAYKDGSGFFVTVYPYGTHHTYIARVKGKTYTSGTGSRSAAAGKGKNATMNDVAFVHEYGAPKRGIAAKGIMRAANEESAPLAVEAAERVYDAWLSKNNF